MKPGRIEKPNRILICAACWELQPWRDAPKQPKTHKRSVTDEDGVTDSWRCGPIRLYAEVVKGATR